MYHLTLTQAERKAIDWIGYRYTNGRNLFVHLWANSTVESDWDSPDWDDTRDLTFSIPEHVAWQIREDAEQEDGYWPCFSPELASKMQAFIDSIV